MCIGSGSGGDGGGHCLRRNSIFSRPLPRLGGRQRSKKDQTAHAAASALGRTGKRRNRRGHTRPAPLPAMPRVPTSPLTSVCGAAWLQGWSCGLDIEEQGVHQPLTDIPIHPADACFEHAVALGKHLLGLLRVCSKREHEFHGARCVVFGVFCHAYPRRRDRPLPAACLCTNSIDHGLDSPDTLPSEQSCRRAAESGTLTDDHVCMVCGQDARSRACLHFCMITQDGEG